MKSQHETSLVTVTGPPAPGPLRVKLADTTGYPLLPLSCGRLGPAWLVILTRALRVPVLTPLGVNSGHSSHLSSDSHRSEFCGQNHDPSPIFQAGHAGSIPVARSTPSSNRNGGLLDLGKGRRRGSCHSCAIRPRGRVPRLDPFARCYAPRLARRACCCLSVGWPTRALSALALLRSRALVACW